MPLYSSKVSLCSKSFPHTLHLNGAYFVNKFDGDFNSMLLYDFGKKRFIKLLALLFSKRTRSIFSLSNICISYLSFNDSNFLFNAELAIVE